jgi:peroxiredoxin family protein
MCGSPLNDRTVPLPSAIESTKMYETATTTLIEVLMKKRQKIVSCSASMKLVQIATSKYM